MSFLQNAIALLAGPLDYPLDQLDETVWDLSEDPPRLREETRQAIGDGLSDLLDESGLSEDALEGVFLSGSITSKNWAPAADLDIGVVLDVDEGRRDEIKKILPDLNGRYQVAEHPVNFFIATREEWPKRIGVLDNVYDVMKEVWFDYDPAPLIEDPEQLEEDVYARAVSWARKLDLELGETERDLRDLDFLRAALRKVPLDVRAAVMRRIDGKIQELDDDVETVLASYDTFDRERAEVFSTYLDKCPGEDCPVGPGESANLAPANIVSKLLERWQYVTLLKRLYSEFKDVEITDENVDDLRDTIEEEDED